MTFHAANEVGKSPQMLVRNAIGHLQLIKTVTTLEISLI